MKKNRHILFSGEFLYSPSFVSFLSEFSCFQGFCQKMLWWEVGLKFGLSVPSFLAENEKRYNKVL
jgi:hypothetical protein